VVSHPSSSALPLYVPPVDEIDMQRFKNLCDGSKLKERLGFLLPYLDPTWYASLAQSFPPGRGPQGPSFMSDEDLTVLIRSGHFVRIPRKEARLLATVFSVLEERKGRRRFILWPRFLNQVLPRYGGKSLIGDVANLFAVAPGSHIRSFDLQASFFQIPLPVAMRKYLAFQVGRRFFAAAKMPMGIFFAPEIMHTVVAILVESCIPAEQASEVHCNFFIDNIRFHGTNVDHVNAAAEAFLARCRFIKATVREEPPDVFLGATVDPSTGKVGCTPSSLEKLAAAGQKVLASEHCTLGELREYLSRLFWASRILRISPAMHYAAIKCARRRFSQLADSPNEAKTSIWPCARESFAVWQQSIMDHQPVQHLFFGVENSRVGEVLTLFTDASLSGYGAVLLSDDGSVDTFQGTWSATDPSEINQLEMRTVSLASDHWSGRLCAAREIVLVMDNTSCLSTLKKGSAHSWALNRELRSALRSLPDSTPVTVAYLASSLNPADALSRGRRFLGTSASLSSAVGLSGLVGGSAKVRVAGCIPNKKHTDTVSSDVLELDPLVRAS
jgi:hypothetical protein